MATCCTCEKAESNLDIAQKPMYIPCRLHALLSSVTKIDNISTLEEVLGAMKDYIYKHALYDILDPRIIHCEKDELGSVLGVNQFGLFELKHILLKLILKENDETAQDIQQTLQAVFTKRKSEEMTIDDNKRFCLQKLNLLPSTIISKLKLNSENYSTDSKTSIMGTVFVKEASDDSCSDDGAEVGHYFEKEKILAIKHMYNVEYDVETNSSSESDESVTDTDSEIEQILGAAFVNSISKMGSDEEFWADVEISEVEISGSDVEICESDKWVCSKCGIANEPPMRYCLKCWEERKGWLPYQSERVPPRRRRKINKKNSQINVEVQTNIATDAVQASTSKDLNHIQSLTSSRDIISPEYSTVENVFIKAEKLCILCCSKPMNATVVHGKIGHQFSCYKCARRLLSLNKTCPICRRPIDRVIHQIVFE